MQLSPDGQPFYIPDNIVGMPPDASSQYMQTAPPMPPPPGQLKPVVNLAQSSGINPTLGPDELPAAPDAGPNSVTGGALPSEVQHGVLNGFPAQMSPDYALPVPQTKAVQKADADATAAYAKAQVTQAKQDAARAAYGATPQGMQDQAAQGQLDANKEQQRLALQQGDKDAAQATEEARIKDKALVDQQALAAQQEKARQVRLEQEQKLHTDYTQAVDAAAKKTIDPNRYWNNMSTGKHVSTAIAVMLSGIGQGLVAAGGGGQVNSAAMSMITSAIDRDVDAQKQDMAQANTTVNAKRNSFMDYHTLTGDLDQAAALKKAEARVTVADQLDANAAHFKGQGAQIAAQSNAAALRYSANNIIADLANKKITQQEKQQEIAIQKQQVGIAGGHLALAQKQFDWTKNKDQQQLAIDYLKATGKDGEASKKAAKDLAEGGVMVPVSAGTDGKPVYEPIKNQDGQPLIVPEKLREKFAEKREGFMKGLDAVDKLRAMRSESGGNLFDTAEKRAKLQEFERAIVGMHEQNGITRFSADVIDLMKKQLTGGADPTSVFKAIMPSLDQAREDMEQDFTGTLRSYGNYTGDNFHVFDPLSAPKAAEKPSDEMFKRALGSAKDVTEPELAKEFGLDQTELAKMSAGQRDRALRNAADKAGDLLPSQRHTVEDLGRRAQSSDPRIQSDAAKQLSVLQDQAQLPAMRQAAREALINVGNTQNATRDEGDMRTSGTVHETAPPAAKK